MFAAHHSTSISLLSLLIPMWRYFWVDVSAVRHGWHREARHLSNSRTRCRCVRFLVLPATKLSRTYSYGMGFICYVGVQSARSFRFVGCLLLASLRVNSGWLTFALSHCFESIRRAIYHIFFCRCSMFCLRCQGLITSASFHANVACRSHDIAPGPQDESALVCRFTFAVLSLVASFCS